MATWIISDKAFPVGSDEEWEAWLDYVRLYGPTMQSLERIRERGGMYKADAPYLKAEVEKARKAGQYLSDAAADREVRR